ncbi:MAG: tryptophan-rich sensory protein [Rikenellaceae bacterium]|nr:tryptophan-rich sensory protein [Rikenellaceae bacterium]
MRKFLAYTVPTILALAIGALGSYIQSPSITVWYPTLVKSSITPPAMLFPIAWTILYILMGISLGAMVAKGDMSLVRLWLVQLLVNFLWSVGFFALRSPLLGLIIILILDVLVFTYIIYAFSGNRVSAWLFVPYLIWLLFATYLTGYIYIHNPAKILP